MGASLEKANKENPMVNKWIETILNNYNHSILYTPYIICNVFMKHIDNVTPIILSMRHNVPRGT